MSGMKIEIVYVHNNIFFAFIRSGGRPVHQTVENRLDNVTFIYFLLHLLFSSSQFFTKWVPRPEEITRTMTTAAVDRSLRRMGTDSLDLLQFHWYVRICNG